MPRFIPDTLRVRDSAKASYDRTGYFYISDTLEVRFELDGVLTAGTTTPAGGWPLGTRLIYSGVTSDGVPNINDPSGGGLTSNDILEYTINGWIASWSSKGLTSTTDGNPYSSIGTLVYSKERENLLVFTGSEWKEVQPASSLKILTTGYTGENTSTLNVFGHTGSKNLVLSGDGSDGTANIELNSPFSSKYFYGPSAPDETVVPLNFGDRWYSTELGSELVWIPNLPGNAAFVAGSTFANDSEGTFQADTNNISFIGQDGKSYIVPQTKFDEFVDGTYDLTQSGGLTGVWVMISIAGTTSGGDGGGSLSEINVDGTSYTDVTELALNSSTVSISSSSDGSSLSLTFGINVDEIDSTSASIDRSGIESAVEPSPVPVSRDFYLNTSENKLYQSNGTTWDLITTELVGTYYYGTTTNTLYYFQSVAGGGNITYVVVTDPQPLVYDPSTSDYKRKLFFLGDITDVTASNPTDGYYLQYNSSTGKWEPGAPEKLDIYISGATYADQDIISFTGQNGANGLPLTTVRRTPFQGSGSSTLRFELTGEAHSSFNDNKFVNNTSSSGAAKKVLTIADDGSIGWEYLRNYDVVDPNKFLFSVTKFGFDGPIDYLSSHTITAGDPGTTFIASDTYSLTAEYNGDVTDKSFIITTSPTDLNYYYGGNQSTDLLGLITGVTDYDSTWTIKYPSKLTGFNGTDATLGDVGRTSITVRITATGSYDGGTQTTATRNVVFKFDNYVYAGRTSGSLVTTSNTLEIDPNDLENWLNSNPDSVYRNTYFSNTSSIEADQTPAILDAPAGEYCFIMWPERLGWQIVKKDGSTCLNALFPLFNEPSSSQTARQALGITLANENGFEERYNIYQFPNPGQNYSGLKISLTGSNPC